MATERLEPSTSSTIALCSPQISYIEFKIFVSLEIIHETEITNLKQIVAIEKIIISKNEEIATLQNKIASLQKDPFSDFRQKELVTISDELRNGLVDQSISDRQRLYSNFAVSDT